MARSSPSDKKGEQKRLIILAKPGKEMHAPLVFLKPYVSDTYSGLKAQMHFHTRTPINLPETGDGYEVRRFMDHRELNGKMRILTK